MAGGRSRPSLKALFLGFSSVGLSGFGGVLPFARRMLVEERRWLTAEEFNSLLVFANSCRGRMSIFRWRSDPALSRASGALRGGGRALGGPSIVPACRAYDHFGSLAVVQGMLRGIAAVGCGLLRHRHPHGAP